MTGGGRPAALDYIEVLEEARRWTRAHPNEVYEGEWRAKILAAFDQLSEARPTEAHFTAMMGGVLFLPEMLYRLTLGRPSYIDGGAR